MINDFDLNTKRMLDLMGANGGDMPLYLHVVNRVLREMRIEQQRDGYPFSYTTFKKRMEEESLTPAQLAPFIQRLDTLESFMPKQQTGRSVTGKKIKKSTSGNDWNVKVCITSARLSAAASTSQGNANVRFRSGRTTYHCRFIMPMRDAGNGLFAFQHLLITIPGARWRHWENCCPR